jgi:hypothetical protein
MTTSVSNPSPSPPLDGDAPLGTSWLGLTFDQPMDGSRGRCRLSWGRLRLHTKNVEMPRYSWDVRDDELQWLGDRELRLDLRQAPCEGFRVRVEWSELFTAAGEPIAPVSYVVPFAGRARGDVSTPPTLGSLPLPNSRGVRRDLTIELYPDQPLSTFGADAIRVTAADRAIPFHIETNRNPPDWIYLQLEELLPPDSEVVVTVAAHARTSTLGARADDDWAFVFRTGQASATEATPVPAWSEPAADLDHHPTRRIEAALRFAACPLLDSAPRLRDRIALVDRASGRRLEGLAVELDRTPAHYRTIFVHSTAALEPLKPGHPYALRWNGLGWPGMGNDRPGELAFVTAAEGQAAIFLAGCPHVSFVATEAGTELQVALQIYAETAIREVWVELDDAPGERHPLTPMQSPRFRDMVDGDRRLAPPELWTTAASRPRLVEVAQPCTRPLHITVIDTLNRVRSFAGLGFDMTRNAIPNLEIEASARPRCRWTLGTPVDSQHLSIHDASGRTWFAGLFDANRRAFSLPGGWDLPAGHYLLQLWLLRATPQDDLWDFAVADRWFDVGHES